MAITLTVTTSSYATTAAANTAYALTVAETPAIVDNSNYLTDSGGEFIIDGDLMYIVDSEG
jgi:hypothetical protein